MPPGRPGRGWVWGKAAALLWGRGLPWLGAHALPLPLRLSCEVSWAPGGLCTPPPPRGAAALLGARGAGPPPAAATGVAGGQARSGPARGDPQLPRGPCCAQDCESERPPGPPRRAQGRSLASRARPAHPEAGGAAAPGSPPDHPRVAPHRRPRRHGAPFPGPLSITQGAAGRRWGEGRALPGPEPHPEAARVLSAPKP